MNCLSSIATKQLNNEGLVRHSWIMSSEGCVTSPPIQDGHSTIRVRVRKQPSRDTSDCKHAAYTLVFVFLNSTDRNFTLVAPRTCGQSPLALSWKLFNFWIARQNVLKKSDDIRNSSCIYAKVHQFTTCSLEDNACISFKWYIRTGHMV